MNRIGLLFACTVISAYGCAPLKIANASISGSGCTSGNTNPGSQCQVYCDTDYSRTGPSKVTCGSDGNWSTTPQCLPTCALCSNDVTCTVSGLNITCVCKSCYQGPFCTDRPTIPPPSSVLLSAPATLFFSNSLSLTPSINFPSCASHTNSYAYTYSWRYQTDATHPYAFNFGNKKTITIPANSLQVGFNHTFFSSVSISYKSYQITANSSATVFMFPTPLLSVIAGGNRQVAQNNTLYLDGSQSSDPDSAETVLKYQWNCTFTNGSLCADVRAIQPSPLLTDAFLALPNGTLTLGVHIFSLTVSDPAGIRTATSSVNITVVNSSIPSIAIYLPPPGIPTINPQDTLRLYGVTTYSNPLTYLWTETKEGLNLKNPTYVSSNTNLTLVIQAGYLQMGETYRFQLSAYDANTKFTTTAFIAITVRSPPINGSCSVHPTVGMTLVDTFTLSCQDWITTDPSSPNLLYSFAYYTEDNNQTDTILTDLHSSPDASVYLPQGNITLVANVYTDSGAMTTVTFGPVQVSGFNGSSACLVQNYTDTVLDEAKSLGDNDQVIQLVNLMLQLMLNDTLLDNNADISCSYQGVNVSVNIFRDRLWLVFLQALNTTTSEGEVSSTVATQLAEVLVVLTNALFDPTVIGVRNVTQQTQALELVIDMLRVLLSSVSEHQSLSQSVVLVLSTLLETVPCTSLQDVIDLMNLLAQNAVSGTVPDEEFVAFVAPRVNSTGVRLYVGSNNTNLTLDGLQFSLTAEMLAANGPVNSAFVDVTITRYDNAVRRCRTSSTGQTPSGDIISIDLSSLGKNVNISDLSTPFIFYLPVDADVDLTTRNDCGTPAQVPVCSWWDSSDSQWKSEGCTTLGFTTLSDNSKAVECSCSHLTDFAVLVQEANGECATSAVRIYRVIAILYLLVLILAAIQLARIVWTLLALRRQSWGADIRVMSGGGETWRSCRCGWNALANQHFWVFLICLCRMLSSFALSGTFQCPLTALAFITAAPYCISFWLFSTIVLEWANVIHLSIKEQKTQRTKLRPYLYSINGCVFLLFLLLFISISKKWRPEQVATGVSVLMSIVYLVLGVTFVIYGSLLAQKLAISHVSGDRMTTPQSGKEKAKHHVLTCSLAGRIAMVAFCVSLCFIVESILWVVSVVNADPSLNFAFSFMDIVSLCAVLLIFSKSVQRLVRENKRGSLPDGLGGRETNNNKGSSNQQTGKLGHSDSAGSSLPGSPSLTGRIHPSQLTPLDGSLLAMSPTQSSLPSLDHDGSGTLTASSSAQSTPVLVPNPRPTVMGFNLEGDLISLDSYSPPQDASSEPDPNQFFTAPTQLPTTPTQTSYHSSPFSCSSSPIQSSSPPLPSQMSPIEEALPFLPLSDHDPQPGAPSFLLSSENHQLMIQQEGGARREEQAPMTHEVDASQDVLLQTATGETG